MSKITLLAIIETWLKTKGLKWKCDPENSRLSYDKDPLDIFITVEKNRVVFRPTTFLDGSEEQSLSAVDPQFFSELESALRHEEKWSNAAKCMVLIFDGMMAVWGPMMLVVVPWIFDRIDDMVYYWRRFKSKFMQV